MAIRLLVSLGLAMILARASWGDESTAGHWQERLDNEPRFAFSELQASVLFSLRQYEGDCQIHIVYDRTRGDGWQFTFVRNDKALFTIGGSEYSVFATDADDPFSKEKVPRKPVLYFADFSPYGCGCILVAYDLRTGKKLWSTQLKGVGTFDHSLYANRVNVRLDGNVVRVTGSESGGNYVEIVDSTSGQTLAHRVFK